MHMALPPTQIANPAVQPKLPGGYKFSQKDSGILVPSSVADEISQGDNSRSVHQAKTAMSSDEVGGVDADASQNETEVSKPQSLVDFLNDTLFQLFEAEDKSMIQGFMSKIENISIEGMEHAGEEKVLEALNSLKEAASEGPEKFQEALAKMDQSILVALKETTLKNFEENLRPILEHGSLPVAAAKVSQARLKELVSTIGSMYENAKSRTELLKDTSPEDKAQYAKNVYQFKQELAELIEKDSRAFVSDNPRLAKINQINKEANFKKALGALVSKFGGHISKQDLEKTCEVLMEEKKKSDADPGRASKLDGLKDMLFNKEGLMIGAMLVPLLGALLSGTLGKSKFLAPIVKPIAGLLQGGQGFMNQLISIGYMISNKRTTDALAEKTGHDSKPAPEQYAQSS